MDNKWYNSKFASQLAEGITIFLICLGIGTCSSLTFHNQDINWGKPTKKENSNE